MAGSPTAVVLRSTDARLRPAIGPRAACSIDGTTAFSAAFQPLRVRGVAVDHEGLIPRHGRMPQCLSRLARFAAAVQGAKGLTTPG